MVELRVRIRGEEVAHHLRRQRIALAVDNLCQLVSLRLDFSDLPTHYPFTLGIVQAAIERELDRYVTELGAPVRWESPVFGLHQDATGVVVETGGPGGGDRIRCAYLVGCDGGRSAVRKLAGIGFAGTDATMTGLLADVELGDPP
ncbi:FAD-dependent monooxygenase [Kribbella qitaiheensis]|uniref:FAD-dependent monooxygenase n=1 Tax=Kribbella qitaiheensis TaxID=1544730 RepID=UPI001628B539|nr:FAD-dependent monooxygenase [Kribbella qitaiheensis]